MRILSATAIAGLLSITPALAAPSTLWLVDASASGSGVSNPAYAEQFSLTGSFIQRVSLGSGFNPNGLTIIGNTGYVSSDSDGTLRTFNTVTGALGSTLATGKAALGALATDGTTIYATDFTGGNSLYRFSTSGALLSTVTLSRCGSYCNGLEYESGTIFANTGQNSGPYYGYTTSGTLTGATFTLGDGGALAYNTDTRTQLAAVSGGSGGIQTSAGTFFTLGGMPVDTGFGAQRFINDLAFQVPEPATLAVLATGLGLLGLRRRRG